MKILIVKTSSMGDLIHTLPVITDIRSHYPNAEIHWLAERPFHQIPALHAGVYTVILMAWRKWRKQLLTSDTRADAWAQIKALKATLQANAYDVIIDLQGLVKSAIWTRIAAKNTALKPCISHGYDWGSAREPLASLAYARRHTVDKTKLATQRSRSLAAKALGYEFDPQKNIADFGLSKTAIAAQTLPDAISAALPALPEKYWACVHGSSDERRLWKPDYWAAVALHLHVHQGMDCVLLWGSEAERERSESLSKAMQKLGVTAIVPPFLTIGQTATILARSQLCVGLDTGFTHLSGALGVNTLSLHSTHDPALTGVCGAGICRSLGSPAGHAALVDVCTEIDTLF